MVVFKYQGRKVVAGEGELLLEALLRDGTYIPHLCYVRGMRPLRTCDLCLVEVDGKVVRACETQVRDGMTVSQAPKWKEALSRLLNNHNLYCTLCDNNVECELHDVVVKSGVSRQEFREKPYPVDDSNPFYVYDPSQCILCGRCVEACQNLVVNEVIRMGWELDPPRVVWNGENVDQSSCVSCGTCVTVCPVNALMEKTMLGRAGLLTGMNPVTKKRLIGVMKSTERNFSPLLLLSELDSISRRGLIKRGKTVCTFCGTGCSFEVWVRGREVLKVEPRPESPVNGLGTCVKGKFGYSFVNSNERLTKPLIRQGHEFREASWEEALDLVARKLREIRDKYGPDSVGVIASCTSTNEEVYLTQKFARQVIGTNNVDNCARYCQSPATTGLLRTVGYGADSGSIHDMECADLLILIGTNTAEAHPVIASRIKRAKKHGNLRLVVVDVRMHEMAERADLFLTPRVGTDLVLINGVARYILERGWEDRKFVEERTENFQEYVKSLEPYNLQYVEEVTGIPKEKIITLAEMIHESRNVAVAWAMGVTQHQDGSETSTAISNLLLLTGNYGRPCCGAFPLRGHANVQGAGDVGGLPNFLPGYQSLNDPEVIKKFEEAWEIKLPRKPGLTSTEMVDKTLTGELKAMYIIGEDKVMADADQGRVREALSKLEFLVVQDLFLTETAKLAHVILPACSSLEKEGTFTNTERRIQRLYRVLDPLPGCKTDMEILQELAKLMGFNWDYSGPEEVMREISRLSPIHAGVTYQRLENFGSLQWPVTEDGQDSPYLYRDRFPFPDGRARFYPTTFIEPRSTGEKYDLYLVNGRLLEHFHWTNQTGRTPLKRKVPETFLEVSPQLAKERGWREGDVVLVESPVGRLRTRILITGRVSGNRVFLSIHGQGDSAVNLVTEDIRDPTSKTPAYKEVPVRVEKLEECVGCPPVLPKGNPRNWTRNPRKGVEVELKWRRKDYNRLTD